MGSFKDNPGRRLISLYVGAMAGLAVAGIFGLDLFSAVMAEPSGEAAASSPLTAHPKLNIVLSGIIMGLGASPTHEVIRLVQEYKERQKGGNATTPNQPEASRGASGTGSGGT
jgi:hypothetical protein